MKTKLTTILLSIFYFIFCIFVVFHNASYRLELLFSGKYLIFLLICVVVFIVLMKVIQEVNSED